MGLEMLRGVYTERSECAQHDRVGCLVTLSRSEGSVALGSEMLRGVYTERSECAQHDSAVTYTDSWINLLNCIIGPRGNLPHPLIHLLNLIIGPHHLPRQLIPPIQLVLW
jgi:hypothetical protein